MRELCPAQAAPSARVSRWRTAWRRRSAARRAAATGVRGATRKCRAMLDSPVEAHGAWWSSRSSKPLPRALAARGVGSIPMRFRHLFGRGVPRPHRRPPGRSRPPVPPERAAAKPRLAPVGRGSRGRTATHPAALDPPCPPSEPQQPSRVSLLSGGGSRGRTATHPAALDPPCPPSEPRPSRVSLLSGGGSRGRTATHPAALDPPCPPSEPRPSRVSLLSGGGPAAAPPPTRPLSTPRAPRASRGQAASRSCRAGVPRPHRHPPGRSRPPVPPERAAAAKPRLAPVGRGSRGRTAAHPAALDPPCPPSEPRPSRVSLLSGGGSRGRSVPLC